MCVVGVGGIGGDVGRLSAVLGMRVVGTRSQPPGDEVLPVGFSTIGGPDDLDRLLAESDFVAVCCHWTPETNRLFDDGRFAQMKPGAILVNVARGEIIDETALVAALDADLLRGVVLDVYVGEFEAPPPARLWPDPRVMITPHVSGASDTSRHRAVEIFCENLAAYIAGRPLKNVIDWERGY
jgi:phosphoglycerate dehydrogenase-like enzyme